MMRSAQLYYLVNSLGYNISICIRHDKQNMYRINCSINKGKSSYRKKPYITIHLRFGTLNGDLIDCMDIIWNNSEKEMPFWDHLKS